MTTKIFFSSNKLGVVTKQQLQTMLDRFQLGQLISSEPTPKGVMKQTMFVTSSEGEFVLKGNPMYEGQFVEEKFFVDNLQVRTGVPVPSPYIIDDTKDIYGWSYALMPRLPGVHFNDPEVQAILGDDDKTRIAILLARTLAELHTWKADQFGEFDPIVHILRPFQGSYEAWLFSDIRFWIEDAKKFAVISRQDIQWVEGLLQGARLYFQEMKTASFVMGDFKPENILLEQRANDWQLRGVIDFTTSYFGDPLADLAKIILFYLDGGEERLASIFLSEYTSLSQANEADIERLKIHILRQRVLDWGCAFAIDQITWDKELPFSHWASQFVDRASTLAG